MDIKLYYEKCGEGKPLLLLHGNGEDCSYFAHQLPFFAASHKVYAIDTRGHGKSPRGTAEFSIKQFAEDLLAFMDEQGIDKADILGFSDGGNIALTFALKYPERVDKLVLNGANLFPAGMLPDVHQEVEDAYVAAVRRRDKQEQELMALMLFEPQIKPEELQALRMPALVIVGEDDMIRPEHSALIADSLPNGCLCVLPGDHFVAAGNPAAFNRVVADFLADLEIKRR